MKTKEYPSLGMTLAFRNDEERQSIVMKQVGEIPLAQHMFDEAEIKTIADAVGETVERVCETLLDRAVVVGRGVNEVAALAFIYVATQGIRDHVDHFAHGAMGRLADSGTSLLIEKLGTEGFDRLILADSKKQMAGLDPAVAAILAALLRR